MTYCRILFPALLALFFSCKRQSTPNVQNPSTSTDTAGVKAARPAEPDWAREAVLYECNVRQFSPQGNLAGVQKQLPRLKELGINVLWLMPIHPIGKERRKGKLGSAYSVRDYYAVNPDFGTLKDLQNLVKAAHELGIKVLLDWVPNHTAWDAVWKKEHPEYYTKINGDFTVALNEHGQPTDWTDVCDLDYANPALRRAMIEAMQHWLRVVDIDGYRVDMAGLVPNDFWAEARPALDSVKQVFMLAEWQDEPKHFESCFNANYGWRWKDVTKDIAAGRQNAKSLDTLLESLNGFYPEGFYQMYFTQNHDENAHSGTEAELYGPAADAFNVLAFTWQGLPLIYNGQEDGLAQRLSLFEKTPIQWKGHARTSFFQKLCALRRQNHAVRPGLHGGKLARIPSGLDEFVYAFSREKDGHRVIVIINLSGETRGCTLHPAMAMRGDYTDIFDGTTMQVGEEVPLNLKPRQYLVLSNQPVSQ